MKAAREVRIGSDVKSAREERLESLLRRALEYALPGGLEDPEGCASEGQWAEELFADARRELAVKGDATNSMTAIGPGASVDKPGDFVVTISADGDCLTITEDGDSSWAGGISLKQAADAAANTIIKALWGEPSVSEETRALILARLYDRMDHDAREASLGGSRHAVEVLAHFRGRPPMLVAEPGDKDVSRSRALLRAFEGLNSLGRWSALNTLILVGLDVSRKFK